MAAIKLSEHIDIDRILFLDGTTKAAALGEMIRHLSAITANLPEEDLAEAVRSRESLMSTGMGHGLAFPHVRMPGLDEASLCIGIQPAGIPDYESLDGLPVAIIVLIAAPAGRHDLYIRLLAAATSFLRDPEIRRRILLAEDPAAVLRILDAGA